ncbi:hypothetical protein N7461_004183 [Penicillium sp. DV-2018c]|nr:hypothetical protein N7461_004183 [Penicillium sp. DV-2018c]
MQSCFENACNPSPSLGRGTEQPCNMEPTASTDISNAKQRFDARLHTMQPQIFTKDSLVSLRRVPRISQESDPVLA